MTVMPIGPPPNEKAARVAAYLHNAGFSGNDLVTAIAIAKAESGWNYSAKGGPNSNGSYDWGLMQINDIHKPTQLQKTHPLDNARLARKIYASAGNSFRPWATFQSGAYRKYIPDAQQAVKDLQAKGPAWERATIASAAGDTPGVSDKTGVDGGLNVNIDNPLSALSSGFNALNAQFAKIAGNAMGITIAVVLLILGVGILVRGAAIGGAAGAIKKVIP